MEPKTVEFVEKVEKILHITNVSFKSLARFYYIMFFITLGNLTFVILEKHYKYLFLSIMLIFAFACLSLIGIIGQRELKKLKK